VAVIEVERVVREVAMVVGEVVVIAVVIDKVAEVAVVIEVV
jgi:hypothetical protein